MRLVQSLDQLLDIDEVLDCLFRQDQHDTSDTTKRRWKVLRNQTELGAAETVIYAQFLPEGESVDLVARMEDLWNIAKQA